MYFRNLFLNHRETKGAHTQYIAGRTKQTEKEADKEERKIILQFNSLIDRDEVLATGMKLKRGSGYRVVPFNKKRGILVNKNKQLNFEPSKLNIPNLNWEID